MRQRHPDCLPKPLSVISPYSAQARLLRERLKPDQGLKIGSSDGFQGRENEAVIISLVRSNSDGEIGFLADTRRMHVALTRARRKLIVIGDRATIAGHAFYSQLLDYFEQIGAYHTVWEEAWSARPRFCPFGVLPGLGTLVSSPLFADAFASSLHGSSLIGGKVCASHWSYELGSTKQRLTSATHTRGAETRPPK